MTQVIDPDYQKKLGWLQNGGEDNMWNPGYSSMHPLVLSFLIAKANGKL
jgi:hypothetical protein